MISDMHCRNRIAVFVPSLFLLLISNPSWAEKPSLYRPIDISDSFNRGLKDPKANDGDSGWTDQGPNDLRAIRGRGPLLGVPFRIGGSHPGHDVILLGNCRFPNLPRSVSVPVGCKAKSLVFLHTAAWPSKSDAVLARYIVTFRDGTTDEIVLRNGQNIANWWNPKDLPQARVAWRGGNGVAIVGVYAMVWANPHPERTIRDLTCTAVDESASVFLLAITAGRIVPKLPSLPPPKIVRPDRAGWFSFAPSWLSEPKSSILDRRVLSDGPAGKHGFLQSRDGKFVFEDNTPFVGWGINTTWMFPSHEESERLADNLAWMGVNLLRNLIDQPVGRWSVFGQGNITTTRKLDPEAMDRLDYFVAQLKKRGIYSYLTLRWGRRFLAEDDVEPEFRNYPLASFFIEKLREKEKEYAKQFLEHVNPYTGLAYKDDPAIAVIEIVNETTIFHDFKYLVPPCAETHLTKKWNEWLCAKYSSRAGLRKAWSDEKGRTNLRDDEDPTRGTVRRPSRVQIVTRFPPITDLNWKGRVYDTRRFLLDVQTDHYCHMRDFLRSIGAKQIISLSDLQCSLPDLAVAKRAGIVDFHIYDKMWSVGKNYANWSGSQGGRLRDFIYNFVSRIAQVTVRGCPQVFGEVNQLAFNDARPEAIAIMTAYGCLQEWNAPIWYNFAHHNRFESDMIQGPHELRADMARFGLFPACSTIYRKRLIQPARSQIDVLLSDEDLIAEQPWAWVRNDEGLAHPNTPFQALPFIFGIRNYLVENKAYKGKATLAISSGRTKPSFRHYNPLRYLPITPQLVADQNRRGNDQWLAKKVIAKLQRAGKNGKAQVQWDPTGRGKHSFTSDTGELTMDFATGTLLINAPAAKGICGVQRSAQLGCATIDVKNPKNAYVLLVAMDGKPLDRSTSILLTALARAENTGMTWNQGRTKINIGKGPVILEPVRAKILLRRAKGAPALTLAAMKPDGKPKATLPMNRTDNRITFEVDGRRYKTIWYQLTASPPATQMKTE